SALRDAAGASHRSCISDALSRSTLLRLRRKSLHEVAVQKADPDHIKDVPEIAAQQLEAAVMIVVPTNRDLANRIIKQLRQVQKLDVEHVAVNFLALEKHARSILGKEFEPALSVRDTGQTQDALAEDGEAPAAYLAVPGLSLFNYGLLQGARP